MCTRICLLAMIERALTQQHVLIGSNEFQVCSGADLMAMIKCSIPGSSQTQPFMPWPTEYAGKVGQGIACLRAIRTNASYQLCIYIQLCYIGSGKRENPLCIYMHLFVLLLDRRGEYCHIDCFYGFLSIVRKKTKMGLRPCRHTPAFADRSEGYVLLCIYFFLVPP